MRFDFLVNTTLFIEKLIMNNFPHCSIKRTDAERCYVEATICDEVMSCPCCCYFLDKRNTVISEEIVDAIEELPEKISLIRIPLLPTPANMGYFGYLGVETIIYNLFRTSNKKQVKNLSQGDTYLKVYYKKDPLFTLPIIMIEVIFMNFLNERAFDELWKTLKTEVLFFTGSVGDIEHVYLGDIEDLIKVLHVPLLIGQPEFKLEGVFLKYNFSEEQILELNYVHSIGVTKLKMDEIINNNKLTLFEEQRQGIQKDIKDKTYTDEEVADLVSALFGNDEKQKEYDDLPF
jgi:hypothetical protein